MEPIEQGNGSTLADSSTTTPQVSTLGDWVRYYLKLENRPVSVVETSLRLAVKAMEALNAVKCRLDEEGLTASLLGSLASSLPLSVLAFGADDVSGGTFGWAQYSKYGRQPFSESQKGADFGLIVTFPDGRVRIALFQAKSDAAKSMKANEIKISKSRKEKTGGGVKEVFQVDRLASYASVIMGKAGYDIAELGMQNVNWVHYLCYLENGLQCVQMSTLSHQISKFLEKKDNSLGLVDVTQCKRVGFLDVLKDVFEKVPTYWIGLSKSEVNRTFPDLIEMKDLAELMDLYVSEDGKGGWSNVPAGSGFERTAIAEVTSPSQPFNTPESAPTFEPSTPSRGRTLSV